MPKKSFYVFLCSLLGVLLFLILHRIVVFCYMYLLAEGYMTTTLGYYELLAAEYFTLIFSLMFGIWYGIWLGLDWYDKVYVQNNHSGFVAILSDRLFNIKNPFKNFGSGSVNDNVNDLQVEAELWRMSHRPKEDETNLQLLDEVESPKIVEIVETIVEPVLVAEEAELSPKKKTISKQKNSALKKKKAKLSL